MLYLSVHEIAEKWQLSERSVRNYCACGRVPGAVRTGKSWKIPETAQKPERSNQKAETPKTLLTVLRQEKAGQIRGGIYHRIQIEMTWNSNHIEGSRLTEEQTRYIYEANTIGASADGAPISVDDVIETVNHFRCIDLVIDLADRPLSEAFIRRLHRILKTGTEDSRKSWFRVGNYKKMPNEVGMQETTPPEKVHDEIHALISRYEAQTPRTFEALLDFHYRFERIHPFQDGNGRIGRLILFKECLRFDIVPFIISDDLKLYYYRGLQEWNREHGYLTDTCLTAQDRMKRYLDYFRIPY